MNKSVTVALIIAVLIYIVFTFYPGALPSKTWDCPVVRKFSRTNNKFYEGFADDNVVAGAVKSYYKTFTKEKYGDNAIVVGLHYTDWCGYCKQMKPVWFQLKKELENGEFSGVVMIENNEEVKRTAGVNSYPTIYKMRNGKMIRYKGRADYNQLREFVLGTSNTVQTYGSMI